MNIYKKRTCGTRGKVSVKDYSEPKSSREGIANFLPRGVYFGWDIAITPLVRLSVLPSAKKVDFI